MPYRDNLLLASLSANDLGLLQPHLKQVRMQQRRMLFREGDALHTSYFPLNAVISLVVELSTGESVETAMVGRDGVVSAASALDGELAV